MCLIIAICPWHNLVSEEASIRWLPRGVAAAQEFPCSSSGGGGGVGHCALLASPQLQLHRHLSICVVALFSTQDTQDRAIVECTVSLL